MSLMWALNRNENGKLCGDVDFDDVCEVAGAVSPVPGGVGLMTVAMLMKNASQRQNCRTDCN